MELSVMKCFNLDMEFFLHLQKGFASRFHPGRGDVIPQNLRLMA